LAQRILNENRHTSDFDSEYCYNEREGIEFFEGIYQVHVKPFDSYKRFIEVIEGYKCIVTKFNDIENEWYRDEITSSEFRQKERELKNCKCPICSFSPTIDEWMSGMIEEKIYIENAHFKGEKI